MKKLMALSYVVATLTLVSCGEGTVKVKGSNHNLSGGTQSEFTVIFKPFNQIISKCNDLYIQADYIDVVYYKQAVAECFFDNLSLIDFGEVQDFGNQYCNSDAEYDTLTPEEQAQVDEICEAL